MKNLKFAVVMLGLLAVTPTFNSCKKENHCLETTVTPEVAKTVKLPVVTEPNADVTFMQGNTAVTEAKEGEKVTLNVVPKEGYRVESVKVDGKEVELPYEFVVGEETPKVEVVVKKNAEAIDLSNVAVENAVVTFKKGEDVVTEAKEGEKVTLNVVAKEGFEVKSVKVDGKEVTLPAEITLGSKVPMVEAVVEKKLAMVSLKDIKAENATISFKNGDLEVLEALEGSELTLQVEPTEGYEVESVKVDGEVVTLPHTLTLGDKAPVVEVVTKKKEAEKVKVDLSQVTAENASIFFLKGAETVTEAMEGDEVILAVGPKDGFLIKSVKVDGEVVTIPHTMTLGKVAPVVEVEVGPSMIDFRGIKQENVTILFKSGEFVLEGGRPGTELVLEVTPDEGYEVESVKFNGTEVTLPHTFVLGDEVPTVEVVTKKKATAQHTYGVISLIGDATPLHGWGTKDYDMQKSETEDYTWVAKGVAMSHHPNGSRDFKIRADHAWKAEWGGFTVTGTCEGVAHIKADGLGNARVAADAEGVYDITFNTQTLKYTFTRVGDL